jgi:hypothetical protein
MVDQVEEPPFGIAQLRQLVRELLDRDLQEVLPTTMELLAIQDRVAVVVGQLVQLRCQ